MYIHIYTYTLYIYKYKGTSFGFLAASGERRRISLRRAVRRDLNVVLLSLGAKAKALGEEWPGFSLARWTKAQTVALTQRRA